MHRTWHLLPPTPPPQRKETQSVGKLTTVPITYCAGHRCPSLRHHKSVPHGIADVAAVVAPQEGSGNQAGRTKDGCCGQYIPLCTDSLVGVISGCPARLSAILASVLKCHWIHPARAAVRPECAFDAEIWGLVALKARGGHLSRAATFSFPRTGSPRGK